jgi:hypothetical protein
MLALLKVYCNSCKGARNHKSLKKIEKSIDDDDNCVSFYDSWEIVKCLGCESISFRHAFSNSHDTNPETGEDMVIENLYPQRNNKHLPIKPFENTPKAVSNIYQETLNAYNSGLNLLCAAGLRAIIESICSDKGITHGQVVKASGSGTATIVKKSSTLEGKINGLQENGIITEKHRDILHEHRFLGNDALHSLAMPSKRLLSIAIEVLEHTIESLYEMDEKAEELTYRRSLRAKSKKKAP